MKFLDKVSLVVFSFVVLILSMLTCFFIFGWISISNVEYILNLIISNNVATTITIVISIVFILLAVKNIYFMPEDNKKKDKTEGVLLENQDGRLLISKETIENIVNSVAKGFESTQNIKTDISFEQDGKVNIDVKLLVLPNTNLNELSNNLQNRIKEVIKNTANIELNKINIIVKNLAAEKVNKE